MPFLSDMPNEILLKISAYLTAKEFARFAEVNSKWKELATDDNNWKSRLMDLAVIPYSKRRFNNLNLHWRSIYSIEYTKLKRLAEILHTTLTDENEHEFDDSQLPEELQYEAFREVRGAVVEIMSKIVPEAITTPGLLNMLFTLYPNNINHEYKLGYTLLHWFTVYGDALGVRYLIAKGAENKETREGDTLVLLAVRICKETNNYERYEKVIRILVRTFPDLINQDDKMEKISEILSSANKVDWQLFSLFLELEANPKLFAGSGFKFTSINLQKNQTASELKS